MNSMQLMCFVEVATKLSFSKAAEHLHVSQPTVSHQIRALEDELGCSLLARSTRNVRLTDEGFSFLPYAQEMIDLEIRSKEQFKRGQRATSHALKIGVQDGFEAHLIAPVLRELRLEDGLFSPTMRQGPYSALVDMLEAGTIDVMPAYRNPRGEHASASAFKRICELPIACICSSEHPLAQEEGPLMVDDLIGAGRVIAADPHRSAPAFVAAQQAVVIGKPPSELVMGADAEVTLALVSSGIGFTIMPDAPMRRREGLCYRPVADIDPIVFGVYVRRGRRAALLDRFIELLAGELAS